MLLVVRNLIFGGREGFDVFRLEASEFFVARDDGVLPEAAFALEGFGD